MKQYGNENNKKTIKVEKNYETCAFHSYFHSCSNLEEAEESFKKLKCGPRDFGLMFFLKNLNEILRESYLVVYPLYNYQKHNSRRMCVTKVT